MLKKCLRKKVKMQKPEILNQTLKGTVLIILVGILLMPATNAEFSDKEELPGHKVTTGYWVEPEVEVQYPNGGEVFELGDKVTISWTASSADPNSDLFIKVFLSTDGGNNYTLLKDGLVNATEYEWTIETKSDAMRVGVEVTDEHGLVGWDESDANFDPDDSEEKDDKEDKGKKDKDDGKDSDKDNDNDKKDDNTKVPEVPAQELTAPVEIPESTPSASPEEPAQQEQEEQQQPEEEPTSNDPEPSDEPAAEEPPTDVQE